MCTRAYWLTTAADVVWGHGGHGRIDVDCDDAQVVGRHDLAGRDVADDLQHLGLVVERRVDEQVAADRERGEQHSECDPRAAGATAGRKPRARTAAREPGSSVVAARSAGGVSSSRRHAATSILRVLRVPAPRPAPMTSPGANGVADVAASTQREQQRRAPRRPRAQARRGSAPARRAPAPSAAASLTSPNPIAAGATRWTTSSGRAITAAPDATDASRCDPIVDDQNGDQRRHEREMPTSRFGHAVRPPVGGAAPRRDGARRSERSCAASAGRNSGCGHGCFTVSV